jgi:SAM-dependent methyltransferase
MRKWHKYFLDDSGAGVVYKKLGQNCDEYLSEAGKNSGCEAYENKEAFFRKYYFGYHGGRLEHYDDFLRKHLRKDHEILSVASGRCANELFLMGSGFKFICSDLDDFPFYSETKKLFPGFEYFKCNVLKTAVGKKFDCIVCLSLIYLFNREELDSFFTNISRSLKTKGVFILDSAGSPDNAFSSFIHDIVLKYEIMALRFLRYMVKQKRSGLVVRHHGYFRSDAEIIESANKAGLALREQKNYGELFEFRRSILFNKLIKSRSRIEPMFETLGKSIPYIRMFKFEKIA